MAAFLAALLAALPVSIGTYTPGDHAPCTVRTVVWIETPATLTNLTLSRGCTRILRVTIEEL